jgi:CSLREA domain-containing protein
MARTAYSLVFGQRSLPKLLAVLAVGLGLSQGTVTYATQILVNTTADELDQDGNCSLREAILSANQDIAVDNCPAGSGPDVILLPAGIYNLSIPGADEDDGETGDLDITADVSLLGSLATVIDGGGLDRVLEIDPRHVGITVEIVGLIIRNGEGTNASGGGIANHGNLTMRQSVVHGNRASFDGGGIANDGLVILVENTIAFNTAGANGGGILNSGPGTIILSASTVSNNVASGSGGGIYSGFANPGSGLSVTVESSTVSGNETQSGDGGGILRERGALVMANSTISSNRARSRGGGIFNGSFTDGPISLNNCTITNNFTRDAGGGIDSEGSMTLSNTILAANLASVQLLGPDCAGMVTSGGYNIVGSNQNCSFSSASGDRVGTAGSPIDPQLTPLANHGGPTLTHALASSLSPAFDKGNPAPPGSGPGACESLDQRGITRPQGQQCDIGAFEVFVLPKVNSSIATSFVETNAATDFTVSVSDFVDPPDKQFNALGVGNVSDPTKIVPGVGTQNLPLAGYHIKEAKGTLKHVPRKNIQVDDDVQPVTVDTITPDRLLVPSTLSLTGPVDPLGPNEDDHYECYQVRLSKGAQPFPTSLQVWFHDPSTSLPRVFDVKQPSCLCLAASVNDRAIHHPDSHRMCYHVRPAKGQLPYIPVTGVHLNNEFGPAQGTAVKEQELCVPATVIIP